MNKSTPPYGAVYDTLAREGWHLADITAAIELMLVVRATIQLDGVRNLLEYWRGQVAILVKPKRLDEAHLRRARMTCDKKSFDDDAFRARLKRCFDRASNPRLKALDAQVEKAHSRYMNCEVLMPDGTWQKLIRGWDKLRESDRWEE